MTHPAVDLPASPTGSTGSTVSPAVDPAVVLRALPLDSEAVLVRDGDRTIVAIHPVETIETHGEAAFERLNHLDRGWWAGFLSYDLGRAVERVIPTTPHDHSIPDLHLARFDTRLVIDPSAGASWIEGNGAARHTLEIALLDTVRRSPVTPTDPAAAARINASADQMQQGWQSSLDHTQFEAAVRVIISLIEAGDCYQVNLTRQLTHHQPIDPVVLFTHLALHNPAPHHALIRTPEFAIVSASPERFLRVEKRNTLDGSKRTVETRPMKGTGINADALSTSAKDRAENVMIVDLARNDLGRVCAPGSIEVTSLCAIEPHPGLCQMVSTVRGELRGDVGFGDLIRATFPPASITGAPKPRVLQVIENLEPVRRGIYCGAIGWFDADRQTLDLNVAIRTFLIADGQTHLGVGSGIVSDSDPSAEWRETELKASRLLAVAEAVMTDNRAHPRAGARAGASARARASR